VVAEKISFLEINSTFYIASCYFLLRTMNTEKSKSSPKMVGRQPKCPKIRSKSLSNARKHNAKNLKPERMSDRRFFDSVRRKILILGKILKLLEDKATSCPKTK